MFFVKSHELKMQLHTFSIEQWENIYFLFVSFLISLLLTALFAFYNRTIFNEIYKSFYGKTNQVFFVVVVVLLLIKNYANYSKPAISTNCIAQYSYKIFCGYIFRENNMLISVG